MTTILVGIQNSILALDSSNGFKIHESLKGTSPQKIAIDSRNPDRAYCATFGDGLWKTDDGGQIFATSNTKELINPLLSRFIVLDIPPYTDEQFIEIAIRWLINEEGLSEENSTNIANQVMQKLNRKDLRDCIKVAIIAKTPEELTSVIDIMK